MTAMMYTAFFFLVVGGAAMAMIAVNEYYDKKIKIMNRIEELLMKLCYGEGLSEQEYQEYKQLSSK